MTSETENIQCPDCGAAVRRGASFCFKCGRHFELAGAQSAAAIESEPAVNVIAAAKEDFPPKEAQEQEFRDTIPDSAEVVFPERVERVEKAEDNEYPPAAAPNRDENEEDEEINIIGANPVVIKAKPQLTSAAAMRRKPKPQREKIEMVWEQPGENSNPIFVIGTITIFILVLLILVFVYFLK